jgi:AcrR family transcriptional regulator
MQMSGPALYRYFDSREALLAALVADSYTDLGDTLQAAADSGRGGDPGARFRALADAYRGWALEHPQHYRLLFATTYGSGNVAPEQTVPAANRSMLPFLEVLREIYDKAQAEVPERLEAQLARWSRGRPQASDLSVFVLRKGLVAWTRLHGVVSLEIDGVFRSLGIDPALIYAGEIDEIVNV